MDPLFIIKKCKPHPIALVKNPFPTRSMIIFAEDGIYVVGMSRDLIATVTEEIGGLFGEAGEMVGGFVGGKLGDWRSSRAENATYTKFAEDLEQFLSEQEKVHRFDYSSLEKFIYRKNMRMVVGIGEYIGFKFEDDTYYFDVGEKHVIDPAVAIIEELAPHAEIKKKTGPMVTRG